MDGGDIGTTIVTEAIKAIFQRMTAPPPPPKPTTADKLKKAALIAAAGAVVFAAGVKGGELMRK